MSISANFVQTEKNSIVEVVSARYTSCCGRMVSMSDCFAGGLLIKSGILPVLKHAHGVSRCCTRAKLMEYMSRFSLCWRCTRSGMSSDPDVVLLHWAFWVQGDLILIYYWGGLCLAAPMGSSPCSAVFRHLRVVNALVRMQLNDWAGKRLLALTV